MNPGLFQSAPEKIDTTPQVPRLSRLVEAASFELAYIMADLPANHAGNVEILAATLLKRLKASGHRHSAAQWAIHEAIVARRLVASPVYFETMSTIAKGGGAMRWVGGADDRWTSTREGVKVSLVPEGRPAPFETFNVQPTDLLWAFLEKQLSAVEETPETTKSAPAETQKLTSPPFEGSQAEVSEDKMSSAKGVLRIDVGTFTVHYNGKSCELRNTRAFHLLKRLHKSEGSYVSIAVLLEEVWMNDELGLGAVQKTVSNLRNCLKRAGIEGVVLDGTTNIGHYALKVQ